MADENNHPNYDPTFAKKFGSPDDRGPFETDASFWIWKDHTGALWTSEDGDHAKSLAAEHKAELFAAFPAQTPPPQVNEWPIKPLEWRRSGWVEAFAKPLGLGLWYSIQPHKPVHGPGDPPFTCNAIWGEPGQNMRACLGEDFTSIEDAKTVAQADYESRILSALATAAEGKDNG